MKRLGEPEFWLLVFLAVLLAQSALGLFFPAPEAAGGIDVIIRTSAAGTTKISCEPGGKNMAEIRQDLLSLNYSPSFSITMAVLTEKPQLSSVRRASSSSAEAAVETMEMALLTSFSFVGMTSTMRLP